MYLFFIKCLFLYWFIIFLSINYRSKDSTAFAFLPPRRQHHVSSKNIVTGNNYHGRVRPSNTSFDTNSEISQNEDPTLSLMRLAQGHFSSQALFSALKLGIVDIINKKYKTVDDICTKLPGKPNKEALLRTLRLLVTVGILKEQVNDQNEVSFGLSPTGALLQSSESSGIASFVSHWTEPAMWNAWSTLPDYIAGNISCSPFQEANDNQTLVEYYNSHSESRRYRNDVARFVSSGEIAAVLDGYDWKLLNNKTIVDIGGGYGDMMHALHEKFPAITCKCLDLANVIADAKPMDGVQLVPGDMFGASTIPSCDVIFMKHVLCDWSDEDAVKILRNCHAALSIDGKVILADALLNSGDKAYNSNQVQAYVDALLMVVGSRMERSRAQLSNVAREACFEIETVTSTDSPSVNITVLCKSK